MDAKKLIGVVAIVFLGFWMFTDPDGLAVAASSGAEQTWTLAQQLFTAIIDFVGALT